MKLLLKLKFLYPKQFAVFFLILGLGLLITLNLVLSLIGFLNLFMAYKHFKLKPIVKDEKLLKMTDEQIVRLVQNQMGKPPTNQQKLKEFELEYKKRLGRMYIAKNIQKMVFE